MHLLFRYIVLTLFVVSPFLLFSQTQGEHKGIEQRRDTLKLKSTFEFNETQKKYGILKSIGGVLPVPVINYEPVAPPQYWTRGMLTQLGFSQVSLTNWAAGGTGSIAMNAYVNMNFNYAKGNVYWDNRAQLSYGFMQSFDRGYRKSDDKIILDSKFGLRAVDHFFFSAAINIRTQFSPGFDYPTDTTMRKVSQFLAPGYFSLGLGIDYKPSKKDIFSVTFSPLTVSTVIVTDSLLRKKYGNQPDESIRWEVGSQLTCNLKYSYKDFKVTSKLAFFSDYLNNPQNIQVNWDFNADYKVNKFMTASLRTNLIYDDNVRIANKHGELSPRVQFKEVFSLAFSYTFGEFKK